ncbi:MAG TPA: GntR family transcriptional regulator [Herpetosiphonaceae bacterium]
MHIKNLGPRTQRIYDALRDQIVRGELPAGAKLPPHIELAATYGVAPLTMRQVLARLEADGLISREHGRGTFVRAQVLPAVLIVEDDSAMRVLLAEYVTRAGHRPLPVPTPVDGLACLVQDPSIAVVFSDVRLPDPASGIEFIRAVRRRWHLLPLVAITGYPDDLADLHGSPECPVLILPKPFWPQQIEETLRLTLRG